MKRFKTAYTCKVTKIHNKDLDKHISFAGLEKLRPLLPSSINLSKNEDLIGVVLNAAVGNYANKNGDAITNQTLAGIGENFVWKYVNLNHDRSKCVGVICNYGFSKFGDNTLLSPEETLASTEPVNLSLAVLLWRPTLSEELIELIETSADEESDEYGAVSASWELFFDDYKIMIGKSKDLSECSVVPDVEKPMFDRYLRMNGGSGHVEDKYVFCVLDEKDIVPGGIGLVERPAAEVKGLSIVSPEPLEQEDDDEDEEDSLEDSISTASIDNTTNQNNLDPNNKNGVTNIISHMKYTFLSKLSNASEQESIAGAIDELIVEKLKAASNEYQAKFDALSLEKTSALESLQANQTLCSNLEKELNELKAKVTAKEKEDAYNSRMAYFEDVYSLAADHRKILASRLNSLDTEDQFNALKEEMAILLASIDKAKIAAETKAPAVATVSTAAVVESGSDLKTAIAHADKAEVTITNTQTVENKTIDFRALAEKAFAKENITISK